MSGETDLSSILAAFTISRRGHHVTMVSVPEPVPLGDGILAVISEAEGTTVVATVAEAARRNWSVDFVAAWLTVDVHSSLDSVGLTAAMAHVLAERSIPCNVIAGFYHDHLLVPVSLADEAVATLESLATTR